jgi:serine protease DegQ
VSRRLSFLIALLAVAALAACSGGDGDEAQTVTRVETVPSVQPAQSGGGGADGDPFERIPEIVEQVAPSVVAVQTEQGEGSGVIWSADGVIVTNAHVAGEAQQVQVILRTGTELAAEVVASDVRTDLAILRVDSDGLPAATFSETIPRIGALAVAIGNPLGFENTASAGIVSGVHRDIPSGGETPALVDLLQTDAAISPGNSGGALVNDAGEVIGINVAFIPPEQRAVSIGFAIPSPTVIDVVDQLLENGEVAYAFLGVDPAQVTPEVAQQLGLESAEGVLVFSVVDGSAAEEAGLQRGDVIASIDGEELQIPEDLFAYLRGKEPGDEVTVRVLRDGEERELTIRLTDLPE